MDRRRLVAQSVISSMQLYQVDNNTVFLMSSDPSTASIGLMKKQQF